MALYQMIGLSKEAAVVSNYEPIDAAFPSNLIHLQIFCQLTQSLSFDLSSYHSLSHVILMILAHVSLVRAG